MTTLIACAALIITIIAVSPIFSPSSMIAALNATEWEALNQPSRPVNFRTIVRSFFKERDQLSEGRPYLAQKTLLGRFAQMEDVGVPPDVSLLNDAASWTEMDKTNVFSRILNAALRDENQIRIGATAATRFASMQQSFDASPKTAYKAYDPIFAELLERNIARQVHRPDVAAASAKWYYYSDFSNYQEFMHSIAHLCDRWAQLADELSAENRSDAAKTCRRWIAAFCVDILANERESGIQCLAADTLARQLGPSHPAIAASMKKLLDEHTRNQPTVGTDRCAQFLSQPPLVMAEYEPAVERLAFFVCAGVLAIASAMTFLMAIGSLAVPFGRKPEASESSPFWQRALLAVLFLLIVPIILSVSVSNIYSASPTYQTPDRALALLHAFVAMMASLIVLHAVTTAHPGRNWAARIRHGWPALILFLLAALFIALPARTTVPFIRNVNYTWPGMLWSFALTIVLIIAAVFIARAPAKRLARSAAVAWLCYAVIAFVAVQLHLRADRAYQKAVVAAYHDPMSARLGADWQKRYLDPVRNAFEPPLK